MNFQPADFVEKGDMPATELSLALPLEGNTPEDVLFEHIRSALRRGLPIIVPVRPHDKPAVIVGGGPSVKDELPRLASLYEGTVFALNGAGLWLQRNGITPHAVILLDARAHNVKFIRGLEPRVHLYIATQCHPDVFDAAAANGNPVTTWHASYNTDHPAAIISENDTIRETRSTVLIGPGTSVGLISLRLVHVLGYRTAHLFGYDSSYSPVYGFNDRHESHAYPQTENDGDEPRGCLAGGRWFVSTPWMIRQAADFQHIAAAMMVEGMNFHLYGDGLLQTMAREALKGEPEETAEDAPSIHPTARIHEKAEVSDDVKIGAHTRVWQFASVIRGTVLGEDCNVASGALLDGPRFGDRCIICQNVAMGPGFLFGDDCFVGPNVTICNDAWPVTSKEGFDIERFRNGFWTVIVKDGASIGANAVVLPGVTIGAGSMVAAGAVVDRNVPDHSVFTRDGQIRALPGRMPTRMRPAS
jgi:acetyltransferase-like isoleucine patch superfamily enzyme